MAAKIKQIEFQKIEEAIYQSNSIAQVLKLLVCSDNTNNRQYILNLIEENGIDTSHFKQIKKQVKMEDYEVNPKICKNCGKSIPFESRRNDFCSHSCSAQFNNKTRTVTSTHKQNSILTSFSDQDFINIIQSSVGWKEILKKLGYSSSNSSIKKDIKERASSLNISLNIKTSVDWEHITKGELFQNRSNWQSARSTIRKLAQDKYQKLGNNNQCVVCGYSNHVEVAHIKAVSEFSDNSTIEEINSIDNLVGLCPNHHWEYDNGLLDISKYIVKKIDRKESL